MLISISIFILAGIWAVSKALVDIERDVFANFLMGAIMQDGGKRKRSSSMKLYGLYLVILTVLCLN